MYSKEEIKNILYKYISTKRPLITYSGFCNGGRDKEVVLN